MSEIKITVESAMLDKLVKAIEYLTKAVATNTSGTVSLPHSDIAPNKVESEPQKNIPQSEPEKQYTIEEVRAVFMKCAKAHGKDEVKKILAELGVTKVTEIKQEDFAKAVKAVEEVK